ncbi:protein NO VEIN-like isoform X3 [Hordeum vulgare subsp. vulgare]|uniref:protein NO VEIN-like isoform X3 n=1 Tax=Hordeum vulgare subsp. vulgare TaxID=112509 RepID=UPI001D1A3505|nr:protein NO VEIN-like isoform X3 [Hordeum vulgare subsp. vulgare]
MSIYFLVGTKRSGMICTAVHVRLIGAPLCPSLKLAVPEGTDHKPGCSNEGSHKPRDSSLSLSPPPPYPHHTHNCSRYSRIYNASVAVDDVIKRTTAYFESNIGASEGSLQLKNVFSLKKLHECESWVTSQFSAQQFSVLGHGTFLEFLDRHGHHFPPNWSGFFNGELSSSSSLEVCVMQQQIEVLLCQAESNWLENGEFSVDSLLKLLKRQFPTITLDIVQNKLGGLIGTIEAQRKSMQTNTIKFSIALLQKRWSGIFLGNGDVLGNDIAPQSYPSSVSSQEAIKCLLKAPFLSDLLLWSNWDMLFAPSLGSFIHWLLNTGPIQDLSCIVTRDGRFVRIDPSATVEHFLEAVIQQSPFQVAVKLLSLLHIYNGSSNAPIALLKCYAQRAIDAIMNSNIDLISTGSEGKKNMYEEVHTQIAEQRSSSSHYMGRIQGNPENTCVRKITSKSLLNIDRTLQFIAKFILGCLGHLPSEFWSLAADILLSGLRTVTKNCYSPILHACSETWQLCMLRNIGSSLGVAEWVEDCSTTCRTEDAYGNRETNSSSCHASTVSGGHPHKNTNMLTTTDDDMVVNERNKSFPGLEAIGNENMQVLDPDGSKADMTELLATNKPPAIEEINLEKAALIIETIRQEEFGLDQTLSYTDSSLLKKQHARLGRALHCLSQELYSQDSHIILELIQNADDNTYLKDVEPTLAFVLQDDGIAVLNNETGFSADNIRALCDIGNSTKKGSNMGYIGNKGIGFKSVFRVTDAPEIHSNGFHVKFDITEGQIGFILPTAIPPFDTNPLSRILSSEDSYVACSSWNTCILLPFGSNFRESTDMCSVVSMFSDLDPSLLLFLHRLKCIKLKNMLSEKFLVMRRKSLADGIVKISHGNETVSWLVVTKKLQGSLVRHGVCSTEIAMAFCLQETEDGEYEPNLKQQPVFAFLPLRNYGLKFILQGDFVLPSSREEVDADSAWNQWLLSEFPSLFVSTQESFCALPCFRNCAGKAVTALMSFVPLPGEVRGFFSQLPHLILSKLRLTRCMVLEGSSLQWVHPCNTLRGWDEQARMLLPDTILHEHLHLGYLSKDVTVSDTLSRALGIHEYGPKVLTDVMSSICQTDGCIESLGLEWLCAWFVTLHSALLSHSSRDLPFRTNFESDTLCSLRKMKCIPLSDGSFSCIADGPIWLNCDLLDSLPGSKISMQSFPVLYSSLRIVSPHILSMSCKNSYIVKETRTSDLIDILLKVGVLKLSGHDIIKNHILVSLSNTTDANPEEKMMTEYMSFIMLHLRAPCISCNPEKEEIVSELRKMPVLLTNNGYKCPADVPIHFSKHYGNSVDIGKLLLNVDMAWIELDTCYLTHHSSASLQFKLQSWRQFFEQLGVTDFVQVMEVEKNIFEADDFQNGTPFQGGIPGTPCIVYDWESPELTTMLSTLTSKNLRENCIYLLKVLDKYWNDYYSTKSRSLTNATDCGEKRKVDSSFMKCLRNFKWIASSMDEDLHCARDLFCDLKNVRSLLGSVAPYAKPLLSSTLLRNDIGFKTTVSHSDALLILNHWITSQANFSARMDQMCKFYTFMSEGAASGEINIKRDFLPLCSIFTPLHGSQSTDSVTGRFMSSNDLYWHDPTGCCEKIYASILIKGNMFPRKMLSVAYPSLHEFFTETCGVPKTPTTSEYLEILLRLSSVALPSQVANHVFRVFVRWANDLHSGSHKMDDILFLKESLQKLETTVLPTLGYKWVSLHPSFGLVCWADDDELKQQFKNNRDVEFIQFGELSLDDKQKLDGRVAALMNIIGIPALSKVVYREAMHSGTGNNRGKASLLNWLLPYMQRYIYKMHGDTYNKFQQNEVTKLSSLEVIVVEKLSYKYMLKGRDSSCKGRFECSCLLQGNILYATQEADSHSILLEISKLFFDGSVDLHFANFLHMVKTMSESDSTVEQIEFFIVNNQKVPPLPEQEAAWSFSSSFVAEEIFSSPTAELQPPDEPRHPLKRKKNPGIIGSHPPNNPETAPDLETSYVSQQEIKANDIASSPELSNPVKCGRMEDTSVPVKVEGDNAVKEDSTTEHMLGVQSTMEVDDEPACLDLEAGSSPSLIDETDLTDVDEKLADVAEDGSELGAGTPGKATVHKQDERLRTGRLGEAAVHQYLVRQLGSSNVKWVNEEKESGLPYDIVITPEGGAAEYVEVKATVTSNKDWFHITPNEWQFALEKGDSFSIAHVVLKGSEKANIMMMKNPQKLCHQKVDDLNFALVMSKKYRKLNQISVSLKPDAKSPTPDESAS